MSEHDATMETALSHMWAYGRMAARVAMRDSDLPKNDVLGEIDAGVTENVLRMAVEPVREALETAGEGAFAGKMARWMPMRQVAALLLAEAVPRRAILTRIASSRMLPEKSLP